MAGSIIQEVYSIDDSGTGYITFPTGGLTITGVTAGSTLIAFVGHADDGADGTSGVATNNGSPTAFTQAGSQTYSTAGQSSTLWYLENVASGSHTITATFTGGSLQYARMRVIEVSGLATSSSMDQAAQAAATTSTPSSGATATLTTNGPHFVLGFAQNAFESSPGSAMTAGSGYVLYGSNNIMTIEYKSYTGTAAQTADFSDGAGDRTVHVAAFNESSSASAPKRALLMGVG